MRHGTPLGLFALALVACSPAAPPQGGDAIDTSTSSAPTAAATATAAPTASASASSSTATDTPAPVVTDVSRANDFAARVFTQSASGAKGNVFVSPPSVRLAFDVVYAGASGKTKDEMAQALSFDPDAAASLSAAKLELAEWIAPKKGAELTFATRLWVEKTEPVGAPFQDRVKAAFGSGLDAIDFKGQPDPSRAAINAWVKKETKDKIVDLLPKGSVTPLTRLVVTNAVYFLGTWQAPFDAKATKSLDFTLADGKKKSVPTMQKTTSFPYVEDGDLKVAALPYGDGSLRMVVLLGPPGASTDATEKRLSSATFKSLHDKLDASSSPVAVSLPKFEIHWGGSFTSVMKALGVQRAFTDDAELDEIGKDLKITDVFHKTYVKVDEKGTEAAASTGIVIGVKSMPLEQKTFAVDHPFVFYIEDARSGRVLFVGKVADPTGG